MSDKNGFFITLEGGEGAGKSTLARRLQAELEKAGYRVVLTREPGGSFLGESIRKILLHPGEKRIAPFAELLLFLAARAQHLQEVIAPALAQGKIVISDRFSDSTFVYQGIARVGVPQETVVRFCRDVEGVYTPHLTFLLDISPEVGLRRARHRVLDRIEQEGLAFHQAIRQGFLEQAAKEKERMVVISAEQPADAVWKEVWALLKVRLNKLHVQAACACRE